MKLIADCVRDVLMEAEACSLNEELDFRDLCIRLPKYSEDDLRYTCYKLSEADLLKVALIRPLGEVIPQILSIHDITYKGHEFIANIRKESVWNGVKAVAGKIGSTSLSALTQIAASVVTELIKAQFGITSVSVGS